ncbi:MAG: PAS domain-containing sensor histidine kinase [Candidatus Sulfotelmatobacter sp.]
MAQKNEPLSFVKNQTASIPETKAHLSDESFRFLVESVQDYAIFLLSPSGIVMTWNDGAERIKGYKADEIIGQHFSRFYTQEARENYWPTRELEIATQQGRFTDEGWRVRKDGTMLWASVTITALREQDGELRGFSKVTRDLTERRALEERTQELNKELRSRMAQLSESRTQLELRTLELQRLSTRLLRIQDDERRRIARELHDDLGQQLAALKMNLDSIIQPTKSKELSQASELADGAISKIRNLSYLLHPPLLDESGLMPAIHWFVDGFSKRSNLKITLDSKPSSFPRLSKEIEMSIFRVVQECITNVYRHSDSPDARIEIHQQPDRVIVRVRDFGKGIDADTTTGMVPITSGAGIGGMRERLKQFGGNLKISRAEPGTLIEATIPLFQLAQIE